MTEEGTPEIVYVGNTRVHWDGQETRTMDGEPIVVCANGHLWLLRECEWAEEVKEA